MTDEDKQGKVKRARAERKQANVGADRGYADMSPSKSRKFSTVYINSQISRSIIQDRERGPSSTTSV